MSIGTGRGVLPGCSLTSSLPTMVRDKIPLGNHYHHPPYYYLPCHDGGQLLNIYSVPMDLSMYYVVFVPPPPREINIMIAQLSPLPL